MNSWLLEESRFRLVVVDWHQLMIEAIPALESLAMRDAFAAVGIPISESECSAVSEHILPDRVRAILALEPVRERWMRLRGDDPLNSELGSLRMRIESELLLAVSTRVQPHPDAGDAIASLHARGMTVGATTRYSRALIEALQPGSAGQDSQPDAIVYADEVPLGPPAPWMIF